MSYNPASSQQPKTMKRLFAVLTLTFLTAISVLADIDGFVSFYVNDSTVTTVRQYGILDIASRLDSGAFQFALDDENGSTDYEITVIDDGNPTTQQIKNRAGDGFKLIIWRLTAGEQAFTAIPYDPDVLCTVTVDRIPPPE